MGILNIYSILSVIPVIILGILLVVYFNASNYTRSKNQGRRRIEIFLFNYSLYLISLYCLYADWYLSSLIGGFMLIVASQVMLSLVGIESEVFGNVHEPPNKKIQPTQKTRG